MFCLTGQAIAQFKERFKTGEITPEKLAEMDSAQRHGYFASFLGDGTATKVNELFEKQLLLKNQKKGIIDWAKNVAGLKPAQVRDIVSRVSKMETVLKPENEDAFLADLAGHKVGATVTAEEAANIFDLAQQAQKAKEAIGKESGDRLAYGRAKVAFDDYINDLKTEAKKKPITDYLKPANYVEGVKNTAGLAKSLKASLDNSVIGRQGLKVAFTNPDIWLKNSFQSFKDIWDTFGGKEVLDEVRADVLSRPNAIKGLYRKEGLAVGVREEAYPVHLPEKIPGLGKLFKASETAFTAFQYRTRADIFDRYEQAITKAGGDTKGIGLLANSLTGRGKLGKLEPVADVVNNVFFSPRYLKSNIDTLTAHTLDYNNLGKEARHIAALNTLKIIGGVATILAIAKAANPDSVELDPRSADFGKIKVGNTRFDVSGGMSSIVALAARELTGSSKSSITHLVTQLDSGKFGSSSRLDVLLNFLENKASPATSVVVDLAKGKDRQGNKPSLPGELSNLLMPLPVSNYLELKNDPNSANTLLAMVADELGISTNTYGASKDWSQSEGKELKQFHETVGDADFKQANQEFNTRFNDRLKEVLKSDDFKALSDDRKSEFLIKEKSDLKKEIFQEYGFHYRKEHQEPLPKI